jgi:glycosyltransferase involved in cell wall biosynthesis
LPQPLVSFLIPAYNVAPFIEETLASVLSDPRDDIEVVVVNDGSTDDTPQILAKLADPRLRIVHQSNKGLPATRNTGIGLARGEFLIFLDGDDLYQMTALDALVGALQADPHAVLSYGNTLRFFGSSETHQARSPYGKIAPRPSGQVLRDIVQRNFIGPPGCCCVRRTAIERAGLFNETLEMCEDWEFYCRLAAIGTFAFAPVTCILYRQHQASMSKRLGLLRENYDRFTTAVFSRPALAQQFGTEEIARLRRSHDAHIHAYIGILALERGEAGKSFAELATAVRRYPPRAPEFIARQLWRGLQAMLPQTRQAS